LTRALAYSVVNGEKESKIPLSLSLANRLTLSLSPLRFPITRIAWYRTPCWRVVDRVVGELIFITRVAVPFRESFSNCSSIATRFAARFFDLTANPTRISAFPARRYSRNDQRVHLAPAAIFRALPHAAPFSASQVCAGFLRRRISRHESRDICDGYSSATIALGCASLAV